MCVWIIKTTNSFEPANFDTDEIHYIKTDEVKETLNSRKELSN